MKKKLTLLLSILVLQHITASAQRSEGGLPASFEHSNSSGVQAKKQTQAYTVTAKVDAQRLMKEDDATDKNGSPLRIATLVPVDIDFQKSGYWTTLDNGQKIWRLTVDVPDAAGIILRYDEFYIPVGGKFFVYDKKNTQLLGAYTHNTNPTVNVFSTAAISGSELVLEYDAPKVQLDSPRIKISKLGYIYNPERNTLLKNKAESCMIDVNCSEGDNWQREKRGIVRIMMKFTDGWYLCSGTLVNNTNQDGTPYVLSASHCFVNDADTAEIATTQYLFNYENTVCGVSNPTNTTYPSLTGAQMMALIPLGGGSDGALVKLNDNIPLNFNAYFNGWDHSNTPATSGVVIHHPNGDVTKISTYTTALVSTGNILVSPVYTAPNANWQVTYSSTANGFSATEPGSSGAPLFDQNKHVVGTLTGGESDCTTPTLPDFYGKFWFHWNQSSVANQRMQAFLDPKKLGVISLDGYDPNNPTDSSGSVVNKTIIFPSPFDTQLNINTSSIIRSIQIANLSGQTVYQTNGDASSTQSLDTSTWPKGVYAIKIVTDAGVTKAKVVK